MLTSLNKLPFRMGISVVTRKYTPRACLKSRKPMTLPTRHEMRPDSPALHAEQLRFPNQTHKEPQFASLNSRESPTTLSQDQKNTDVTSGTQNRSVCPKSNSDEGSFPCIGSITIPGSASYRTSGLTPCRKLERFHEITVSSTEDHQLY